MVMLFVMLAKFAGKAQIIPFHNDTIPSEWMIRDIDNTPSFGLYKDNWFLVGTSLGPKANKHNTNAKFQISIRQRLTKSTLPWGTYLYLFYTQRIVWNVFEESMPMLDFAFNPGIGLTKPFYYQGRFLGSASLILEHESNGRDKTESRSWNRLSLCGSVMVLPRLVVNGKFWIPIIDGENNRDILSYSGIFQVGVSYHLPNNKFGWSLQVIKRRGWNLNCNTIFEFNWHVASRSNQYLFLQYYNGYGETLIEYNKFVSQIRVGIVIKPRIFSEY